MTGGRDLMGPFCQVTVRCDLHRTQLRTTHGAMTIFGYRLATVANRRTTVGPRHQRHPQPPMGPAPPLLRFALTGGRGPLCAPFCRVTLRCSRTRSQSDSPEFQHLGKLIRNRRLDMGANQVICARRVGVRHKTLKNWEADRVKPASRHLSRIVEFIRYQV